MSLAEVMPYEDEAPRSNDRTPPQDLPAEQCVLGAMLMSKDAIADVVETLRGTDFYRPAHEQVFDAILELYGRGEPADAITVASELTKKGEIGRVGGAPYLHTLLASVPVAANAGYYAEIVREKAILRRLVNASMKIGQMSYAAEGDVTEIVDRAQAEVYGVTDRRASEDYKPLSELMQPTLDEIEAIGSRGGQLAGVPTGFLELDDLTNGLHAGQMVIVAARPGMGKALALDTDLPTPTGWTTMGEVKVGQQLVGSDGRPTTVTAATEIMLGRRCFEIQFTDGATVIADADHQWSTTKREWAANAPVLAGAAGVRSGETHGPRWRYTEQSCVVTSAEMARAVAASDDVEWLVPGSAAMDLPMVTVPARPYELGRWLVGAPGTDITRDALAEAGMPLDRIPVPYLRGSECQRRDLLAGLLDWGRSRAEDGELELRVHGERLAVDVHELLLGLGFTPMLRQCAAEEGVSEGSYALRFDPHRASKERRVHAIREVSSVPVRCVEVDADDHLYLASRAMIPTHNSTLGLDLSRSASIKNGLTSAIFSLEMSQIEITMRLLSAEANIPLNHIRNGKMSDDDWQRMARKMGEVSEAPLFIDDSPNLTMMEIRAKARRLRQRHDLKLVVIDYIQLMTSGKKVESRQLEVSEFSRNLKLLAKELEVPVVALSQLNRGPEQRNDKKPMLSDLRESGCLTAETRIMRADTGEEVALGELRESGARNIPVWSLDERHRLVQRTMTHVFPSGTKEVFRLKLASGREVTATANHPFLTYEGWMPLAELLPGTRLAVPADDQGAVRSQSKDVALVGARVVAPMITEPHAHLTRQQNGPERTSDVFWDAVVEIAAEGMRDVYDATVLGTHNFVADGVIVHNSLEQDADMVILLNRPDIHDKESERAGEADIDVAKHRNGPTRTITVAFQGHYSRFMDMQH